MIKEFLSPHSADEFSNYIHKDAESLSQYVTFYLDEFPDLKEIDIAIIGVEEDRGSEDGNRSRDAHKMIRESLYKLYCHHPNIKLGDLGVLKQGQTINDTYAALSTICAELMSEGVIPIILGGSHDLSYAQYTAYEKINKYVNVLIIDERIDVGLGIEKELHSSNFIQHMITHTPSTLFDLSVAGFQQFITPPKCINALADQGFELYRLAEIQRNLEEIEPVIRNAHMLSMDIRAIRISDAPAARNSSVNGFFGQEICKIAQYAGMNDRLTSFGIYEMDPVLDERMQTPDLIAQMIWYFLDGFYSRKSDFPILNEKDYVKYIVDFEAKDHQLIFWNSKKTARWWVELPSMSESMNDESFYIPCSHNDYMNACKNEIPERWIRAYEKLN